MSRSAQGWTRNSSEALLTDQVGAGRPEVDCAVHAEPVGAAAAQCVLEGSGSSLSFVGEEPLRSEERRVGKECVSTCRSRWSPHHQKTKQRSRTRKCT